MDSSICGNGLESNTLHIFIDYYLVLSHVLFSLFSDYSQKFIAFDFFLAVSYSSTIHDYLKCNHNFSTIIVVIKNSVIYPEFFFVNKKTELFKGSSYSYFHSSYVQWDYCSKFTK
ncbi:hypothetical protein DERF_009286 [Dermatophagoides farinae]|uniref:Uncharacterized protein n=1 Tax=Dermatophagoides farinae TaxID=6954 RepID=A0A922HUM0_DERFA|nr:hypothetical protein DERF_009286 [Dermatophagoides farinae]